MTQIRAHLVLSLFAMAALAGCIGDDAPPAPAGDAAMTTGNDVDEALETATEEAAQVLVETPVSIDGESPPGIWLCAASPALGGCQVTALGSATYRFDVEYPGTLTGWDLVLTFTSVTPENPGMLINARVGVDDDTQWFTAEGASPVSFSQAAIESAPGAPLELSSWTMPDADVGGAVWVDPIPQGFHIEGVLYSLVEE